MAVYNNSNTASSIAGVEFTPVSDGNFSFFYAADAAKKEAVKQWLTSKEIGQEIITETTVSGQHVLVTHGEKTKDELIKALEARGDQLKLAEHKQPTNYWAIRGAMSFIGQNLQLWSGWKSVQKDKATGKYTYKGLDTATMGFATLNQAANLINFVFGGEQKDDPHQLNYLKTEMNAKLQQHLPAGSKLPAADEKRAELQKDVEEKKPLQERFVDWWKRNSVRAGEIGLRYLGSLCLVFPIAKWGKGWKSLSKGEIINAWKAARNDDKNTLTAGILYVGGKTLGLFSTIPDPYDPESQTALDTFRDKYTFRLATLIETAAAGMITYDRFKNRKIMVGKKEDGQRFKTGDVVPDKNLMTDYHGGIGGGLFTVAFLSRFLAPFGKKKVNMNELHAHVADSLAQMPPDKLPMLIAESAAMLKDHFSDQHLDFGKLYTQIMTDLYRYHHISLDNLGTEPDERIVKAQQLFKAADPSPGEPPTTRRVLQKAPRPLIERTSPPTDNHAEKTSDPSLPSLGLAP